MALPPLLFPGDLNTPWTPNDIRYKWDLPLPPPFTLIRLAKIVMIKVVLQNIPTYVMSCLKLLKLICNKIIGAIMNFWWQKDPHNFGNRFLCWDEWQSKFSGVLAFGISNPLTRVW